MEYKLKRSSVEWAIQSIAAHSDGDLFPKNLEIDAVLSQKDHLASSLSNKSIRQLEPGPARSFFVPKSTLAFRRATQLDPQDSIILTAILRQYGQGIEDRRAPENKVFSYRFGPTDEHNLYGSQSAWYNFWTRARDRAQEAKEVLYCDIADFYNQISHHTVENQLAESGFPDHFVKWITNLLKSTTAGVSRGVPIGPHSTHLLAEASLIQIDNDLRDRGIDFLRYADDIVIFCSKKISAKQAIWKLYESLDSQQRLIPQTNKTHLFAPSAFQDFCKERITDRPINRHEKDLLELIAKYSHGDPYSMIEYSDVDESDWDSLSEAKITEILNAHLSAEDIDYVRLRWLYRRLAQIGHPVALEVSLNLIEQLGPCMASVCTYFASIQEASSIDWKEVGRRVLALLGHEEIKQSPYLKLSILSLFTRNTDLNHFSALASQFDISDSFAQREILLAAYKNRSIDWVRSFKNRFSGMEPWVARAFILCCSQFPADEKEFFLRTVPTTRPLEEALVQWAKAT